MTQAQILVVEDESIVALEIQKRLVDLGYAVPAVVASGQQAVEQALALHPDLILLDVRLAGEMDGVEAAQQIRAQIDIPIVYLSAYADAGILQRAKVTEPYGYVLKPFEGRELYIAVEIALYKHEMERKLKEGERWLANTLRSIGDAVIATDPQGCVKFVNGVAETLTGWTCRDAMGREVRDIFKVAGARYPHAWNPVGKTLSEGVTVGPTDQTLTAKDGREIAINFSSAPIKDERGGTIGAILVFRDVSEYRRVEQETRRRAAHLEALNATISATAVAHHPAQLLETVLDRALWALGLERGAIWLYPQPAHGSNGADGRSALTYATRGLPLEADAFIGAMLEDLAPGEPGTAASVDHALSAVQAGLLRLGLGICLSAPIVGGGRSIGGLGLITTEARRWTGEETALAQAIGRQLGMAAERLCLFEEVRHQAEQMALSLAQLRELDRVKSEFMQNVSHELRTPLALIQGYATMLDLGELGELPLQQQAPVAIIAKRARAMARMVEDITSLLETQNNPPPLGPVALDNLVRSALRDFQLAAQQAGVALHADIPAQLPPVSGHSPYLRRVLDNLLDNAIKFTPAGGSVTAEMWHEGQQVVLRVRDTGIGIEAGQIDRIFERFYQIDGSIRRQHGGVGLGLAIVKEIVNAYGGQVRVESQVGRGSAFTVTLPIAAVPTPAGRPGS